MLMENTLAPHELWQTLLNEARALERHDAALAPLLQETVLRAENFAQAMVLVLAEKLAGHYMPPAALRALLTESAAALPSFDTAITADLHAIRKNDPAARDWLSPFLFFKGLHALEAARLSRVLWQKDRRHLALFLQNRISDVFGVDIHPAAALGQGVMLDHATGIVIGETAVVEDDVLLWHSVTLGGRDFAAVDRHPKVRKGASIGANATVLGNVNIGAYAKVAAGSVVLEDVPAGKTAAGVPARIIN